MVRFTTAVCALLALQYDGTNAFGVARPLAAFKSIASATQLNAQGTEILMPALSSTMKEGKVVTWLKAEGDAIEAGEAIMVVESDKADMDVEAFEDGFLAKIIVAEGDSAPVGQAVALIAATEADIASVAAGGVGGGAAPAPKAVAAAPAGGAPAQAAAAPDVAFSKIDMPALSSTMKEGKVVSWLKSEGDAITAGEAIMVVESDKADMDVEAFEDGFLAAIITAEGDTSAVGSPVALIAANEADIPALKAYAAQMSGAPAPAASAAAPVAAASVAAPKAAGKVAAASGDRVVASPLAKKKAEELGIDISSVVGTGPDGRITANDVELAASGSAPKKAAPAAKGAAAAAPAKPVWTPAAGVIAATPMARAAAKKAKLDISKIKGTGQLGRVTLDDVQLATGEKQPEKKKAPASGGAPAPELPDGFVKFTGMQKAVSNNMDATLTIPVFRVSREIEMDGFEALYNKLKPSGVTLSALIAKAVALAVEKHPLINSKYSSEQGGGIHYQRDINIAMAVSIDGGLITPVLMHANERGIKDLAENWGELVQKARTGGLSPKEYQSGTFTISNMGMFGVTEFGALLPAGQGCILAIAGTQDHIVPDSQAILGMKKIRKMTVTLSCDHRQIYGSDAAVFLKTLNDIMTNGLSKLS